VEKNRTKHIPVIIIGGGPIGLFLGICLSHLDVEFRIFEKRSEINSHSRSIGIHPPSLDLFKKTEIIAPFYRKGLKIHNGLAFVNRRFVGSVSFRDLPLPHNFILSLPQYQTEEILEQELKKLATNILYRSAKLKSIDLTSHNPKVYINQDDSVKTYTCDFLIGCDGKNSKVRSQANISFHGRAYPDTYVMGDFDDTTSFKSDAAVFLHQKGVVESFPLPQKRRRWVIKTDGYVEQPTHQTLANKLKDRINIEISRARSHMISSFGVQHHMAEQFVKGRIILAGDAAHVVSPIGGQGMNLGWLDAWELSKSLGAIFKQQKDIKIALEQYQKKQQNMVRKSARRAEWNMKLGRKFDHLALRKGLLTLLTKTPIKHLLTHLFAMQKLDRWPV